jgi:hypothetical protein
MRRIRKVLFGLRVVSPVTSANFACSSLTFMVLSFLIAFFVVLLMVHASVVGPQVHPAVEDIQALVGEKLKAIQRDRRRPAPIGMYPRTRRQGSELD